MIVMVGPATVMAALWVSVGGLAELPASVVVSFAAAGFVADDESPPAKEQKSEGEETQKTKPSSLDEELLKELDNDLMDDLEDDLFEGLEPKPSGPRSSDSDPDATRDLDEELLRELDDETDALNESGDPLSRIGRQMRRVEERIAETRADETTRTMQRRIVEQLDKLLEKARQQQQSQSSSSQQSAASRSRRQRVEQPDAQQPGSRESTQPAEDSTARLGKTDPKKPDPAKVRKLLEELWGHLPLRERERVLNSTMDQFLPLYEQLIEQYFKRLAEEFRNGP